jgi:RNA polymerase sigma factor (sigma-70 family)
MASEAPAATDTRACEQTVQAVYGRRSQEMFGFARRLGLSDEDASDAVQEAMLRLMRELTRGTDIADPEAWSFRVLYRLGMDSHRLRSRIEGLTSRLVSVGALRRSDDGNPERSLDTDSVWRAVDGLPARQRAVLYLRYRVDMPYERIAVALGISPGAARGHASTALATLRRRLGEESEP